MRSDSEPARGGRYRVKVVWDLSGTTGGAARPQAAFPESPESMPGASSSPVRAPGAPGAPGSPGGLSTPSPEGSTTTKHSATSLRTESSSSREAADLKSALSRSAGSPAPVDSRPMYRASLLVYIPRRSTSTEGRIGRGDRRNYGQDGRYLSRTIPAYRLSSYRRPYNIIRGNLASSREELRRLAEERRRRREWVSCPDLTAPEQVTAQERPHGTTQGGPSEGKRGRVSVRTQSGTKFKTETEAQRWEEYEVQNNVHRCLQGSMKDGVENERKDYAQGRVKASEPGIVQYRVQVDRTRDWPGRSSGDLRSDDEWWSRRSGTVWSEGRQADVSSYSGDETERGNFSEERPHRRLTADWDCFRSAPDLRQTGDRAASVMTRRDEGRARPEEVRDPQCFGGDFRAEPAEWLRSRLGPPGSLGVLRIHHPPPLQTPPLLRKVNGEKHHHRSSPSLQCPCSALPAGSRAESDIRVGVGAESDSGLSESGSGGRRRQDAARHHFLESLLGSSHSGRTGTHESKPAETNRFKTTYSLSTQERENELSGNASGNRHTSSPCQTEPPENLLTPTRRSELSQWTIEHSAACRDKQETELSQVDLCVSSSGKARAPADRRTSGRRRSDTLPARHHRWSDQPPSVTRRAQSLPRSGLKFSEKNSMTSGIISSSRRRRRSEAEGDVEGWRQEVHLARLRKGALYDGPSWRQGWEETAGECSVTRLCDV